MTDIRLCRAISVDTMSKRKIISYLLAAALAPSAYQTYAASPGLWDGVAEMPAESLRVPENDVNAGTFEYVPLSPIYFESDRAIISHEGQRSLDAAANYLLKHTNIRRILVEGHTDEIGNIDYNDKLSDRRANIVRNYLTIKGVDPELINMMGKGEYHPVDQNWTREGRKRNRHVSIYAVHWNK